MANRNQLTALRQQMKERALVNSTDTETVNIKTEDTPLYGLVDKLEQEIKTGRIYYAEKGELLPYPDEKIRLKLHTGDKRQIMSDSIKQDGILDPVLVWKVDDKKYIMAGHNRVSIGEELGISIPYIIFEGIEKTKADRIVIVTNLQNRQYSEMLPSELVNMLDRLMLSYDDVETREEIYKDIDSQFSLSKKKILQYLKLKTLIPEFMTMLDDDTLSFLASYKIAGLSTEKQNLLYSFIKEHEIPTVKIAVIDKLMARMLSDWDEEFMMKCFGLIASRKRKRMLSSYKIDRKLIEEYVTQDDVEHMEDSVREAFSLRKKIKDILVNNNIEYDEEKVIQLLEKNIIR